MDLSVGSNYGYNTANILGNTTNTDNITSTLKNTNASDKDLMDACKNFESYMLEQVFKGMEQTVPKDDDEQEDDYMKQFGDKLYEEYAKDSTENQSLGLAQMLYESMKRNTQSDISGKK